MAKKFYVVWQGRETGIFSDWPSCKRSVDGFAGARYKSFISKAEAEWAFKGRGGSASGKATTKRPSTTIKTYSAREIDAMPEVTKIFTDGGCEPNPGQAGSGISLYRHETLAELWYGLYNPKGTNNTAELNALHQALLLAQREIAEDVSTAIFCDSKYTIQCITQWAFNWQKKGWTKPGGEIKNLALIQEIFALYVTLKDKVKIYHVNGHVGVEGNELADRMSIFALSQKEKTFRRYDEPYVKSEILAMRPG